MKVSVSQALNKAKSYVRKGKIYEARKLYEAVLESFPKNKRAKAGIEEINSTIKTKGQALPPQDTVNELIQLYHSGKIKDVTKRLPALLDTYPQSVLLWNIEGAIRKALGQVNDAANAFRRVVELNPNYSDGHNNLGNVLEAQGQLDAAIASYQQALTLKPGHANALGALLRQKLHICDWSAIEDFEAVSMTLGIDDQAVPPSALLPLEDNPQRQMYRSQTWAKKKYKQRPLPLPEKPSSCPQRLRIGYFSADFRNHPVLFLMAGLFREHNKDRFEIYAYSYGPPQGGELREQLVRDVDKFTDVHKMSDAQVMSLAREHQLDIAVDLTGYTKHTRSQLFAYRLAPIQINFLGYPGTMGAKFMDYIVADNVVIPAEQRQFYSENVIYLPHTYLPSDDKRLITQIETKRSDFSLPDDAFVFCCFNNNYKIGPIEFNIWMRLLKQVDGSVLWLLRANKWAESNLCKEAERRGVDANRLIFADRLPHREHLARHKHGDVFIDTFNYNAHTTSSEALWAGLPVVTKVGKQFAARVAASLLEAVGLPELITKTEREYESLLLNLATNDVKLKELKEKLAYNIVEQPLFDTVGYTRGFEKALEAAYMSYLRGLEPEDIVGN